MLVVAVSNVKTGQHSLRNCMLRAARGPLTLTPEAVGVFDFRSATGERGSFALATQTFDTTPRSRPHPFAYWLETAPVTASTMTPGPLGSPTSQLRDVTGIGASTMTPGCAER